MTESYVVIGDGVAGSTAAETIRDRRPEADVTVVTDEGEALYNRILIKEFAKGTMPAGPVSIHDRDWYAERDVDLRLRTLVTDVRPAAREVETSDGETLSYDALVVATGGTPAHLPVPGATADGIHEFWTFEDAREIRAAARDAGRGVVVGAGLLGLDLAAVCAAHDVDARYLMRGAAWWRYALSEDGASIVHDALRDRGVEPTFGVGVERFETDDDGHVTAAVDTDGERHPCDWAGVAVGLDYNTEFLDGTGVDVDGGVIVDEHMRTGVPGVYAAGDVARYRDPITGEREQNGAWGSAKEQGRVAATNAVQEVCAGAEIAADGGEREPGGAGGDRRATDATEAFRWVPSYTVTHFDFPLLSFGHPTTGEAHVERRTGEREWRRVALRDGRVVGGVLIGDLSHKAAYERLMREEHEVVDTDALLADEVDVDAVTGGAS